MLLKWEQSKWTAARETGMRAVASSQRRKVVRRRVAIQRRSQQSPTCRRPAPNSNSSVIGSKQFPKERGSRAVGALAKIAMNMRLIQAAALTTAVALRAQRGDWDVEIAGCLRIAVCDPVDAQIRELQQVIRRLGGGPSESDQ